MPPLLQPRGGTRDVPDLRRSVRPPVCADDRWYPRDAAHLSRRLAQYLANVDTPSLRDRGGVLLNAPLVDGQVLALISPHAGYTFSGQTAAYAYKQLEGRAFTRAVVLGPSHFADLGAQAVNQSAFYETPLGKLEIDAAWVNELDRRVGVNFIPRDREHSLEMQLPFLQHLLGTFKLAPLMLSYPFYVVGLRARNYCEELSAALAQMLDDQTILVASSDLSHLHDYDAVTYFDQGLEDRIAKFDIGGLIDYMVNEGECRACGDMAIITVLMAAQARGANKVQVLYRTNSGDVTGVRTPGQYTVGYMAAVVYRADV